MARTSFFRNFPKAGYQFGDGELPINFQNLSVYIDAFDQVKEFQQFYQAYQIQNNQRPDHVSYELYGSPEYHWTLWLMNDSLRISGWPLDNSEVYSQAQKYYPNKTVTTNGTAFDPISGRLRAMSTTPLIEVGNWVWIAPMKKAVQIIRVDQNFARVHLNYTGNFNDAILRIISETDANAINNVDPNYTPTVLEESPVEFVQEGWDAIHHYEDADGNWVNPTNAATEPYAFDWSSVNTFQSISYFQRLRELNDEKRAISVLKPELLGQVVNEFNALLKRR
jgi:hypothetical protein